MNDQNPASTPIAKPSIKERAAARLNRDSTPDNDTVKTNSTIKDKAKTGLAVVGTVTIAGVAAITLLKKRGVQGVAVDLPDVDVTTDAS